MWQEDSLDSLDKVELLFTGKQVDAETGWYNFGARYLDPKTGIWLSSDPALGEYIPRAPLTKEDKEANGKLPGNGGIYNPVNFALYHFAGNNPIRYTDPDGRFINVLIGAAVGAVVGAAVAAATGGDIGAAAVGGAVTGGMAGATGGLSLAAEMGGAALAGSAGYLAESLVSGKGATPEGVATAAAGGALGEGTAKVIGKVADFASGQVANAAAREARAAISTGRTIPKTLNEKLAMAEVKANPKGTTPDRMPAMNDSKNGLYAKDGWVKRTQNVNGVEIHYVENLKTHEVIDFKFKD